jgi:peptidoglycan hydrolase-like protein with peptidoglycan-binding domain
MNSTTRQPKLLSGLGTSYLDAARAAWGSYVATGAEQEASAAAAELAAAAAETAAKATAATIASVKAMQTALKAYATRRGNPMADPGSVDGVVGPKTITAIANVAQAISRNVPILNATPVKQVLSAVANGLLSTIEMVLAGSGYDLHGIYEVVTAHATMIALALVAILGPIEGVSPLANWPSGTIAAEDPSAAGTWRIAIPSPTGSAAGLGCAGCSMYPLLGEGETGFLAYIDAGTMSALDLAKYPGIVRVAYADFLKKLKAGTAAKSTPYYKNPWVIGGGIAGLAIVSTALYFLFRKPKAA